MFGKRIITVTDLTVHWEIKRQTSSLKIVGKYKFLYFRLFHISGGGHKFKNYTFKCSCFLGKITQSGDVRVDYENYGSPFDKKGLKGIMGDGEDRHRTAAVRIAIGQFQAGINLFTGERNATSYQTAKG